MNHARSMMLQGVPMPEVPRLIVLFWCTMVFLFLGCSSVLANTPAQFTLDPPLDSGDQVGTVRATDAAGRDLRVHMVRPLIIEAGHYKGPLEVRMEVNGLQRVYGGNTERSLTLTLRSEAPVGVPLAPPAAPSSGGGGSTPMLGIALLAAFAGAGGAGLALAAWLRWGRATRPAPYVPLSAAPTATATQTGGLPFPIVRKLAEGGIANIYVCHNGKRGRPVLLKILRSQHQNDADVAASILHEARVLEYLTSHSWQRCPQYVASGTSMRNPENEEGTWPWFAMSEIGGTGLDQILRKGPLAMDRAMAIACAVLDAVIEMHDHGIIHRDLSPANMILAGGRRPFVNIIDFGSSRVVAGTQWAHQMMSSDLPMQRDAYAAPEQIQGYASAAEPADTYAVGIIVYEILMGARPFATRREHDAADRALVITALTRSGINKDVAHFIGFRALNVDPRQRTSLGELRFLLRGAYGF